MTVSINAPRFERLLDRVTNKDRQSIALAFVGADQKRYGIELSAACAPLVLAALISALRDIQSEDAQAVVVTGTQTAMSHNGRAALIFTLEGGGEIPFEFRADAGLANVGAQFIELASVADPKTRN